MLQTCEAIDNEYALHPTPVELLKMVIGATRVIDGASIATQYGVLLARTHLNIFYSVFPEISIMEV